jgi:hypothetical protein
MEIKGVCREVLREKHLPPKDGVHRASNVDGYLKGARGVMFNDNILLPRGTTGFMYRHKKDKCVKIFYSFHHNRCCSKRTVIKQFKKHSKLYHLGVATKPHNVVKVELNFDYYGKGGELVRHVHEYAYGIVQQYVHYPKKAWLDYSFGRPYDWDADDHPDHSPKGYHKFADKLKPILLKNKIYICGDYPIKEKEPPKLGDMVWDMNEKRWYIVDVG